MVASPVLSPCNRDEMSPTGVGGLHVSTSFGTAESLMPMSREGSLMRNLKPSRANMLLSESSAALEQLNNDIVSAQERLIHLVKCAGAWSHSSDSQSTTGNISPATKKDRKKFVLRRKKNKSNTSTNSAEPPASASMSESESGLFARYKSFGWKYRYLFATFFLFFFFCLFVLQQISTLHLTISTLHWVVASHPSRHR